jgi:hypothetical protein
MRYRKVERQGKTYGLRCGETLEDLLSLPLLESSDEELLIPAPAVPPKTDVKTHYFVSMDGWLVDRATFKRSHHKWRPPQVKPRTGPGSGRAGGARATNHRLYHVGRWVPPGTPMVECPVCQLGLARVLLRQRIAHQDGKDADMRAWEILHDIRHEPRVEPKFPETGDDVEL